VIRNHGNGQKPRYTAKITLITAIVNSCFVTALSICSIKPLTYYLLIYLVQCITFCSMPAVDWTAEHVLWLWWSTQRSERRAVQGCMPHLCHVRRIRLASFTDKR